MEKRTLGNTGIPVSRLCFGTLTLGPLQRNLSPEAGGEIIAAAIARGVNFFDTAELYETYPHIREGLRRAGWPGNIVISSKTYAYTRALAVAAVEGARAALDRDVIDIFMLHEQESVHTLRGHREALDYLYECKAKGIVRAVGASMHHVAAVRGAIHFGLDVIHPLLNIDGLGIVDGTREDMEAAVSEAHAKGMGVFAMKALGGGNLIPRAEECLRYALGLDFSDAVAIGCQSVDEIDANIGFFETGRFTEPQKTALAQTRRTLHIDDWCIGCGACAAFCPQSALRIEKSRAVCDPAKCVLCGYCAAKCESWAIKVV